MLGTDQSKGTKTMNMTEYYQKREKELRGQWFKDHVARLESYTTQVQLEPDKPSVTYQIQRLLWSKPGTNIYRCHFIIHNNTLLVHGDIGEAVYCWGENISVGFLAGLNLDYFAGKCCASEKGRHYTDWDADVAKAELADHFKEYPEEKAKLEGTVRWGSELISSRDEWHHWLQDNGYDVFGDAWYEWAPSIGDVIDWRCQGHLVGIQMAVQQLKAKAAQPA